MSAVQPKVAGLLALTLTVCCCRHAAPKLIAFKNVMELSKILLSIPRSSGSPNAAGLWLTFQAE